jgi:lipopolysaccharide transport system ATP-binding protein
MLRRMPQVVIASHGLGKRYRLGRARRRRKNLRDAIVTAVTAPLSNYRELRDRADSADGANTFWALRDVSFSVQNGEVLGIVGRNGAGKSTLLKILSRITDPTEGYVDIYGRIGSLLEVGTGFHPELTGRDNVFLNGSILGMDRSYIQNRFDEIAEFAGVGDFLDTQVKFFSSGMRVRLAFAVAAHLEPEVLIIDEVLAVGDAEFQRKCLSKMNEVGREGRTVLFVSHDMSAVRRLCTRAILLEGGRITHDGATADVVNRYLAESLARSKDNSAPPGEWIDLDPAPRAGKGGIRFSRIRYGSANLGLGGAAYTGGPLTLEIALRSASRRFVRSLAVRISDQHGSRILGVDIASLGQTVKVAPGDTTVTLRIEALHLNPGQYVVGLRVGEEAAEAPHDELEAAFRLDVLDSTGEALGHRWGVVPCSFAVLDVSSGVVSGVSPNRAWHPA